MSRTETVINNTDLTDGERLAREREREREREDFTSSLLNNVKPGNRKCHEGIFACMLQLQQSAEKERCISFSISPVTADRVRECQIRQERFAKLLPD